MNRTDPMGLSDATTGRLIGEIVGAGVDYALEYGFTVGPSYACAWSFCEKHIKKPDWFDAYGRCGSIFVDIKVTPVDKLVSSCADRCIDILNEENYQKMCSERETCTQ